uniref:Putative secreted protein n=1 Tax=Rhipicephalus microplus TaxID=6941 RepID=A0A6G5A2Q6_RHIMP
MVRGLLAVLLCASLVLGEEQTKTHGYRDHPCPRRELRRMTTECLSRGETVCLRRHSRVSQRGVQGYPWSQARDTLLERRRRGSRASEPGAAESRRVQSAAHRSWLCQENEGARGGGGRPRNQGRALGATTECTTQHAPLTIRSHCACCTATQYDTHFPHALKALGVRNVLNIKYSLTESLVKAKVVIVLSTGVLKYKQWHEFNFMLYVCWLLATANTLL